MLQDPAPLFSQHLLLLSAQLILFSLSMRVEEWLDLVLVVMQFQLFLAHVWMSNLELTELLIRVPLLFFDFALPLWERHLVLPATVVNIGRLVVLMLLFSLKLRCGFRLGWFLLLASFALTWAFFFALVFALTRTLTLALWFRLLWLLVLNGRLGAAVVLFWCSVIHWLVAKLALFVIIVMMLILLALLIPFFHLFFEVLRSLLHRFFVIFLPFLLLFALQFVLFRVLLVPLIVIRFFLTPFAFLITLVSFVSMPVLVVTLVTMVDTIAVMNSVAWFAVIGRFGMVDGMVDNMVLVVAMVVRFVITHRMVVVNVILGIVIAVTRCKYLVVVVNQRLHLQDQIASLH